jgi:hypothetical protein
MNEEVQTPQQQHQEGRDFIQLLDEDGGFTYVEHSCLFNSLLTKYHYHHHSVNYYQHS